VKAGVATAAAIGLVCVGLAAADREARVDAQGVLRWADDGGEVALLGVNYYTPFTVDFAELARLGLDHRQTIRDDVAHFRRLGLGCIRLHCFDREFSDAEGNLIDNRHVELLDFLIDECRRNDIYTVLTPIAWWGGHYAPGTTHGFSERYPMHQMTTDPRAWAAQARFLKQFAEHVNRFTGRRYADDPAVLAFECINEPLYPKDTPDGTVTAYINALADALRASGTRKPIYYNSWHGRNAAAGKARIDGVTGSVYPTGLAAGRALKGSQLEKAKGSSLRPDAAIASKSRMIYEFDAADVPGSHMYPPMAKFFRSEGVQVAAQFQYDPLPLAAVNRNWKTHHLNLVHTPGKALSLAIAAEVFRRVPRGVSFGTLPEAAVFPPFRSAGEQNLSELVTDDSFLYSNSTESRPPKPAALKRVWGCGSSPVVTYGGSGAYFLDRIAPGVWRVHLYPDVFTSADPYTGSGKTKVHVLATRRLMTVRLPDLGEAFSVRAFDDIEVGSVLAEAREGVCTLQPGDYLLIRGQAPLDERVLRAAAAAAPRYAAPAAEPLGAPLLRAEVPGQWRAGAPLTIRCEAVNATNVTVRLRSSTGVERRFPFAPKGRFVYEADIPGTALTPGVWRVTVAAVGAGGETRCPDGEELGATWFPIAGAAVPLVRLTAAENEPAGLVRARHGVATATVAVVEGRVPGSRALRLSVEGVGGDGSAAGYTLPFERPKWPLESQYAGLRAIVRGGAECARLEIGFRMRNGQGLGCNLSAGAGWSEAVTPADELIPLWGLRSREAFRWEDVERVSVLTGAWLLQEAGTVRQTADLAALEWVSLERAFALTAADDATPWSLFDVDAWLCAPIWTTPLRRGRVTASDGRTAVRLGVDRFDGERDSVSLRVACDGQTFARLWRTDGEEAVLHVRARAACPRTTSFELALIETGGVSWGAVVPLNAEWREVNIPLAKLRLFAHWDKSMTKRAGKQVRLSRLESVNVCFGKWLYPDAAAEPHAVEIAAIGVTAE